MSEAIKKLIGDELYNEVITKLGDKKFDIISDNYIPKARFDEINGSKNELKTQIGELTGQLELLKVKSKGNTDFEKTIADLQGENKNWETKYKNTLFDSAVKHEASLAKARDVSDVLAFIKRDDLTLDETTGAVKGLSTQLAELKKAKPYLFDLKEGTTTPPSGGTTNPVGASGNGETDESALRKAFGL